MAGQSPDRADEFNTSSDAAQLLRGLQGELPPEKVIDADARYSLIITDIATFDKYREIGKVGMGIEGAVLVSLDSDARAIIRKRHESEVAHQIAIRGLPPDTTIEQLRSVIAVEHAEMAKKDRAYMLGVMASRTLWGRVQMHLPNRMRTRRFRT